MARARTTTWTRRETWHGHDLETDCTVDYSVSGRYQRATRSDPEEWPEVSIGDVRVEATGERLDDLTDAEEQDIIDRIDLSDEDEDDREYDDDREARAEAARDR